MWFLMIHMIRDQMRIVSGVLLSYWTWSASTSVSRLGTKVSAMPLSKAKGTSKLRGSSPFSTSQLSSLYLPRYWIRDCLLMQFTQSHPWTFHPDETKEGEEGASTPLCSSCLKAHTKCLQLPHPTSIEQKGKTSNRDPVTQPTLKNLIILIGGMITTLIAVALKFHVVLSLCIYSLLAYITLQLFIPPNRNLLEQLPC